MERLSEEQALLDFVKDLGHAMVPKSYVAHVGDHPVLLGEWVRTQREEYRSGTLMNDTVDFLESIDSWQWDPKESSNSENLVIVEALTQFLLREDTTDIPFNHIEMIDDEPVKLGEWRQRQYIEPPMCGTPFIKMSSSDAYDYKSNSWVTDLSEGDRKKILDFWEKSFERSARSEGLAPPTF